MPSRREHEPRRRSRGQEPYHPTALSPELAGFLKEQPGYTCVFEGSDHGTVHIIKAPAIDILSLRGTFPIQVLHELHRHPASPVVRTVISFFDQPARPLSVETFTNVGSSDQRTQFAALAEQDEYLLLFYDERLRHRLAKRLPNTDREGMASMLVHADALLTAIPDAHRDFDRAKVEVMERTRL